MSNNLDTLSKYNPWWDDAGFRFEVIDRPRYTSALLDDTNKWIDVLIGARRVGKTFLFRTLINMLLDRGVESKRIIFVTSEIRTATPILLDAIIEQAAKRFGFSEGKFYLFADEVQDIQDWQKSAKLLYDNFKTKIYLSGSSSLVLKPETTKLTGRFLLHEVLPLDFHEYLIFKKLKLHNTSQKNQKLVEAYLQEGGYPEFVLTEDRQKLNQTVESTLYRDLLSHYGIRNPAFLRDLLDYLSDKVTNSVSMHRVEKDLGVSDETAKFYLQYLQDVYLVYPVFRRGKSHRIAKGSVPKYYFNDTGVLFLRSLNAKIGALAENAVYIELRRLSKSKEHAKIFYDMIDGTEIDFYCEEINKHVEVKYRSNLEENDISYLTGNNCDIVIPGSKDVEDFKNVYPELQFIELWKFLSTQREKHA